MNLKVFAKGLAPVLREFVARKVSEAVVPLQTRMAHLEDLHRKTLADVYRGGFQPNTVYERGEVISDKGGVWLAMADTAERPGSSSDWRLILRGRA